MLQRFIDHRAWEVARKLHETVLIQGTVMPSIATQVHLNIDTVAVTPLRDMYVETRAAAIHELQDLADCTQTP